MRSSALVRLDRTAHRLLVMLCLCLLACGTALAQNLPVSINFQPAASPVPTGFIKDSGEVYGDRGNGYTYGWNQFASVSRDYDVAGVEPEKDTLIATNGLTWDMALPSGGYKVTVCVGNPTLTATARFKMLAEGSVVVDETVGPGTPNGLFAERSAVVAVTDGKLSLTNSEVPSNHVCYIKIEASSPQGSTGLTATAGSGVVHLSWTPAPGATSYRVQRATASGGPYTTLVDNLTATSYTDTTAVAGTPYYYVVVGKNQTGTDGPKSNEASVNLKSGIKVNAGGADYVSASLGKFSADNAFTGGSASTLASGDVQGTEDDALYRAMRASSTSFTYTFTGLSQGTHELVLHFVEPSATAAGVRQFNVIANGVTLRNAFDIYQEAGGANLKAVVRPFPVTVPTAGGQVQVKFENVKGNAIVSALELHTAPSVTLTSPTDGASFTAPATISLEATASDADGYVSRVEFYAGETKIGEDTTAPYSCTWETVADGAYDIWARAIDNDGRVSNTGSSHVTVGVAKPVGTSKGAAVADAHVRGGIYGDVNYPSGTMIVRRDDSDPTLCYEPYLRLDISGLSQIPSAKLRVSARLSDPALGAMTYGVYAVEDQSWTETGITGNNKPAAGALLGTLTISTAGYAWRDVDVTAYVQQAKAAGKEFVSFVLRGMSSSAQFLYAYSRETAAYAPHLVIGAFSANLNPTVSLTSPAASSAFNAPARIELAASAHDPDGGIVLVEFWANGQKVGEDRSFAHAYSWQNVAAGTYSIVARAFDNDGAMAESAPVVVSVGKPLVSTPVTQLPDQLRDTFVRGGSFAGDNYGGSTVLIVKNAVSAESTYQGYVRFDLSGKTADQVRSAKLKVSAYMNTTEKEHLVRVFGVANTDWQELAVTWNDKPVWGASAGSFRVTSTSYQDYEADVTAYVQEQLRAGKSAVSFALANDYISGSAVYIRTKESGAGPQLVLGEPAPNVAPTVSITAPADAARFEPGATVTLSADASDADGQISKVEFYAGGSKIGEDSSAPFSVAWPSVPAGSHTLTAKAFDNDGQTATSAPIAINVSAAPTVTLTAPAADTRFGGRASIGLSADASDPEGRLSKVVFLADGAALGEDAEAPFTFTWTGATLGQHTLKAVALDQDGRETASTPVTIMVTPSVPGNLRATAADGKVYLAWDPSEAAPEGGSSGAGGEGQLMSGVPTLPAPTVNYNILRSIGDAGQFQVIAGAVAGASFIDAVVSNGTTYSYAVEAVQQQTASSLSGVVSVTPRPRPLEGGNGHWRITALYSGTVNTNFTNPAPGDSQSSVEQMLRYDMNGETYTLPAPGVPYDLAYDPGLEGGDFHNEPMSTDSGGILARLHHIMNLYGSVNEERPSLSSRVTGSVTGGNLKFVLQWLPDNGDWNNNPAPLRVPVYYSRDLHIHSSQSITGADSSSTSATVSTWCGGHSYAKTWSTSGYTDDITYNDGKRDPDFRGELLPVTSDGVAVREFEIGWSPDLSLQLQYKEGRGNSAKASAVHVIIAAFAVAGFDLSKFDSALGRLSGGNGLANNDPSFTRWLPLDFSPVTNSQPFLQEMKGKFDKPWGNIHCTYSIHIRRHADLFDLNAAGLYLIPDDTNGKTVNWNDPHAAPGTTYRVVGNSVGKTPDLVITDANGDRLVWTEGFVPHSDVRSTLERVGPPENNCFVLKNAGPPGAMKQRGRYTYKFAAVGDQGQIGPLLSISDDLGNEQTLHYVDTDGARVEVRDRTSGRRLRFFSNASGYIDRVEAPVMFGSNQSVIFSNTPAVKTLLDRDGYGRLRRIEVWDGLSNTLIRRSDYDYQGQDDPSILLASISGATVGGVRTLYEYTYDSFGRGVPRVSAVTVGQDNDKSSSDDPGRSVQATIRYDYGTGVHQWGSGAHTYTVTDPRGNVFRTSYRLQNHASGEISGFTTKGPAFFGAGVAGEWKTDYHDKINDARAITTRDPLGRTWLSELDQYGNVVRTLDPANREWRSRYSPDGLMLYDTTDPMNSTWSFAYGGEGGAFQRLTGVRSPSGHEQVRIEYNGFGQPSTVTVPAGTSASGGNETVTYEYHATTGDLKKVTNPAGDRVTLDEYSSLGDLKKFSLYPDGQTPLSTTIEYDAAQMPVRIIGPSGVVQENLLSNGVVNQVLTKRYGALLDSLTFTRDTRGRTYRVEDSVGRLNEFRFDLNSNITQVWDGNGNITFLAYGANNEPVKLTWPGGATATVTYDEAGRVVGTTDERNYQRTFHYDTADRLREVRFSDASKNLTLESDAAGRLLKATTSGSVMEYAYAHPDGLMTGQSVTLGTRTLGVTYTYYPDGKRHTMSLPDGTTYTYTYTNTGRLASLASTRGETTSWEYDGIGRIKNQTTRTASHTEIETRNTFGNTGQVGDPSFAPVYLRRIEQSVGDVPVMDYQLTYSDRGQLTGLQASGASANESSAYDYDGRGRLKNSRVWYTVDGQTHTSTGTFTYDLAGNLNAGSGWTYNAANQLTEAPAKSGGLSGASGLSDASYDAAGNLVSANGMTLVYNAWGDLEKVEGTPAGTVTFTYDAAGRRASKKVGGKTTLYVWDGQMLVAEVDGDTGDTLRTYVWGPTGLISDHGAAGQDRFYLFDATGNARTLLDGSGQVVGQGAYNPYGAPVDGIAPNTPLAWNGRFGGYCDAETGLILMGARYYAPSLGRFITRDPSGFAGGPNVYAYCLGDPINFTDPGGDTPLHGSAFVIGAGVGAVVEGFIEYRNGGTTKSILLRAGRGALIGGTTALLTVTVGPALGCSTLGVMGTGAITGVAGDLMNQGWDAAAGDRRKWDWKQTLVSGAFSAVAGPVLNKVFGIFCFPTGTPVQMADGTTKPIEEIKKGDVVIARDPRTGKTEAKRVKQTIQRQAQDLVAVALADEKTGKILETITATPEHPFYVDGKGFVEAGQLGVGNAIVTRAGPRLIVKSVEHQRQESGVAVFNFEVEDFHTYFVGTEAGGVWVHNACRVIGRLKDTSQYIDKPGYVVMPSESWSRPANLKWLKEGFLAGDEFMLVTPWSEVQDALRKHVGGVYTTWEVRTLQKWGAKIIGL